MVDLFRTPVQQDKQLFTDLAFLAQHPARSGLHLVQERRQAEALGVSEVGEQRGAAEDRRAHTDRRERRS